MVTKLNIVRDINSIATYMIPFSDDSYQFRLNADVQVTLAVPAGVTKAIISGDDYYFVSKSAITLPALDDPPANTGAHQAFDAIDVTGVTTLYFRSRNAMDVTVSFYK
jgi:hypothetical protein